MQWPYGKKIAFTIIDDTDNSFVENIKPVYDLLYECKMKTTKTVWVYPPRDKFTGGCLLDNEYYNFINDLNNKGFEIALHNVGSGIFNRREIISGIEKFKELMGFYPKMQINHASNPDNIYWGAERYSHIVKTLIKLIYREKRNFYGCDTKSKCFWGDISKKHIKYIRNHVFNGINTMKYDSKMPYKVKSKDKYSNYWFSSSDAHTIEEFIDITSPKNIEELEKSGGVCIIYTHFASGFVDNNGLLNSQFEKNIRYLSNKNAWFATSSEILDYLLENKSKKEMFVSSLYLNLLDARWIIQRLIKKIKYKR